MFLHCNLRWALLTVMVAASPLASSGPAAAAEPPPAVPVPAAEEEQAETEKPRVRNWRLRLFGAVADDDGGVVVASETVHAGVAVDGGGGVGVSFEYRTSPRIGIEMGAMAVGGTVRVGVETRYHRYVADVEIEGYVPITFGLNYHPLQNPEIVDLYVGPLMATTILSNVGIGPGVAVGSHAEFGLGANFGADVNFSRRSRWSFSTSMKYIRHVTSNAGQDPWFDFDPLIFTFGFGFRF
jgi:outer membrane protein W